MLLTWLYVPGDRPDRFDKAVDSGADAIVLDLEDAVVAGRKEYARAAVAEFVTQAHGLPVFVRVNELGGPEFFADIDAVGKARGLAGLRLPKVESAAQVIRVAGLVGAQLHCLVESAIGLEMAYRIASAHPSVAGVALGEADLRSDLGVIDDEGLRWARGRIVIAARAAGLPAPPMSVYPDLSDVEGLRASCAAGRRMGFLGRAALHPKQLPVILEGFRPTADELERSRELLAAVAEATERESGVSVLPDGRFADRAMIAAAQRTVHLAARYV